MLRQVLMFLPRRLDDRMGVAPRSPPHTHTHTPEAVPHALFLMEHGRASVEGPPWKGRDHPPPLRF